MVYSVGRILKFSPIGWKKFKKNSNLPEHILNNAVVKYVEDELIVVDENRLYRKIDNTNK